VPDDDNFNVRTEVNDLAIRYAKLPDGPDKETAFLKLVEWSAAEPDIPGRQGRRRDAEEVAAAGIKPRPDYPVEDLSHPASGLQDHEHR
jgi:hypothetical protein